MRKLKVSAVGTVSLNKRKIVWQWKWMGEGAVPAYAGVLS
jgi:hypothetical protein